MSAQILKSSILVAIGMLMFLHQNAWSDGSRRVCEIRTNIAERYPLIESVDEFAAFNLCRDLDTQKETVFGLSDIVSRDEAICSYFERGPLGDSEEDVTDYVSRVFDEVCPAYSDDTYTYVPRFGSQENSLRLYEIVIAELISASIDADERREFFYGIGLLDRWLSNEVKSLRSALSTTELSISGDFFIDSIIVRTQNGGSPTDVNIILTINGDTWSIDAFVDEQDVVAHRIKTIAD
jgi:hypothetical protein